GLHALLVVLGRGQRRAGGVDDLAARLVEECEVEIELAREVLIEHRLGDPRALGDVVHRGRVEALGDEDLERRRQQLGAALAARQARAPGALHTYVGLAGLAAHGPQTTPEYDPVRARLRRGGTRGGRGRGGARERCGTMRPTGWFTLQPPRDDPATAPRARRTPSGSHIENVESPRRTLCPSPRWSSRPPS